MFFLCVRKLGEADTNFVKNDENTLVNTVIIIQKLEHYLLFPLVYQ